MLDAMDAIEFFSSRRTFAKQQVENSIFILIRQRRLPRFFFIFIFLPLIGAITHR